MADIQLKHFFIPAAGDAADEEALNRFLRGHQVLEVRQEFVADGVNSVWCIAVRYAQTREGTDARSRRRSIDYKDVLEPEAFARFVELRNRRKVIADAESLPAFAVFTDKELAGIAELKDPKPEDLKAVKGIAKKRVERYGVRILTETQEKEDETGGKTV